MESSKTKRAHTEYFLLENAEGLFIAVDLNGAITFVNRRSRHLLGSQNGTLVGKSWLELVPEGYRESVTKETLALVSGRNGHTASLDFPLQYNQNITPTISWQKILITDENGAATGVLWNGSVRNQHDSNMQRQAANKTARNQQQPQNADDYLRQFYIQSPVAYLLLDKDGTIVDVNAAWLELLGYDRQEVLGKPLDCFISRKSKKTFAQKFSTFQKKGKALQVVFKVRHKKGHYVELFFVTLFVVDEKGEPRHSHCIFYDIASLKKEEYFRLLFEHAAEAYYIMDFKGRFLDSNRAAEKLIGYNKEELIGKSFLELELLQHKDMQKAAKILALNAAGRSISEKEMTLIRKDGEKRTVIISTHPIDSFGQNLVLGIVRDITEQLKAQKQLQVREARFRALFENAQDAIFILDDQKFVECNPATLHIFGCNKKEDILGHSPWQFSPPEQPDGEKSQTKARRYIAAAMAGQQQQFYWQHIKQDGTAFEAEVKLNLLTIDDKPFLQAIVRDITAHRQAEQQLRESEQKYRSLIDQSQDAIYLLYNNKFEIINQRFTELFGYTPEETKADDFDFHLLLAPESYPIIEERQRRLKAGEQLEPTYEFIAVSKDGRKIDCEVSTCYVDYKDGKATQGILRDISEKKRHQKAMLHERQILRTLIDNLLDDIYIKDRDSRFIIANNAVAKMMGADSPDDLIGKTDHDFYDKKMADLYYHDEQEIIRTGIPLINKEESVVVPNTGKQKWLLTTKVPMFDAGGHITGIIGIGRDITERKLAEEEIQQQRNKLADILVATNAGTWEWEVQTGKLVLNERWAEMIGYTLEELAPLTVQTWIESLHPDDFVKANAQVEKHFAGETDYYEAEFRQRHKNGSWVWVLARGKVVQWSEDGKPLRMTGTHLDITKLKMAEQELRLSKTKYQAIFESSATAMLIVNFAGDIIMANKKVSSTLGYDPVEMVGKQWTEFVAPQSLPMMRENFEKRLKDPDSALKAYEAVLLHKNGSKRTTLLNVNVIPGTETIVASMLDITERKKADDELRKLSSAVHQSTNSIIITDINGNIEYVNPTFCRMTGYAFDEVVGKNPRILQSGQTKPEVYEALWHNLTSGKEWRGQFINKRKNGDIFYENAVIAPIKDADGQITHYLGIKDDITEQRKLEEQLRQSQKMEAIGKLAGGVAHDFNNLLTVINGYSEILLTRMDKEDPVATKIQQIRNAGKRAAALTEQLLAFSRRQVLKPEVFNLNDQLRHTEKMLKRLIGEDIELVTSYKEPLPSVEADMAQIDQIIMNLAVNARDAMPKGGKLIIETDEIIFDEAAAKRFQDVAPGRYVLVAVTDTGTGISRDLQDRIFDPFFTTKEKGKGTGLGLSTVYGILKQSGGHIWVYSEVGHGSTFKFCLPAVNKKAEIKATENTPVSNYRGSETILLVEDEEDVRLLAEQSLKELGYTIHTAEDGRAGLKKAKQLKKHIDLLLVDVIMPNMSGKQLADKIGRYHPETKICFMSGYTDDAIAHHGALAKGVNLIQKPFALKELAKKVRQVIDSDT